MSKAKSSYNHDEIKTAVARLVDAREYVVNNLGTRVFGDHSPVDIIEESIRGLNDADDVVGVEQQIRKRILRPVEAEFNAFSSQVRRINTLALAIGSIGILCTLGIGVWTFVAMRSGFPPDIRARYH